MNTRRWLRITGNIIATIMDMRSDKPTAEQTALARRLTTELDALTNADKSVNQLDFWHTICRQLEKLAREDDPLFFMRWEPVTMGMVHGMTPSALADWWMLRRSKDWRQTWMPALRHKQYGHPPPFVPMMTTNAMAVEHAAHLYRFRELTGKSFSDGDCVIEFGGGYGSMCRLVHGLGFQGTYIIFDLPHVLALQRYYLALHGIAADGGPDSRVVLCCDLSQAADIIASRQLYNVSAMSTWALSEMPLILRQRVESILEQSVCARILLSYQNSFGGIDNGERFKALSDRTAASVNWIAMPVYPVTKEPSNYNGHYLFGVRR
jgi:hypothetical protein